MSVLNRFMNRFNRCSMVPFAEERVGDGSRRAVLVLLAVLTQPAWGAEWRGADGIDLSATFEDRILASLYVGTPDRFSVLLTLSGGPTAPLPDGARFFELELPANVSFVANEVLPFNGGFRGAIRCSAVGTRLSCLAENDFEIVTETATARLWVSITPTAPGGLMIPADGLTCTVDADDVISEIDETNNDCAAGPLSAMVFPTPTVSVERWLQATMWNDVLVEVDGLAQTVVNAMPVTLDDGTRIHALNEILRHPISDSFYVLYRPYESTDFSLGLLDTTAGITPIGDTGASLHDATFSDAGHLYAVGREGLLYSIDLVSGAATALCDHQFGASIEPFERGEHTALAWDSIKGQLVQVAEEARVGIDLGALPADPNAPCIGSSVATNLRGAPLHAEFVDDQLIVANFDGELLVVARDGGAALVDKLPMATHGMVPGSMPPAPPVACPASAYLALNDPNGAGETLLFAVDTHDAALAFVDALPFTDVKAMAWNRRNGRLVLLARLLGPSNLAAYEVDPCTGEIVTGGELSFEGRPPQRPDTLHVSNDGRILTALSFDQIFELEFVTGELTLLGGAARKGLVDERVRALSLVDGDPVVAPRGSFTEALFRLDLAAGNRSVLPLSFVSVPAADGMREVYDLDGAPGSADLLALVRRVKESGESNNSEALANVLAIIMADGSARAIGPLPAGVVGLTGTFDGVFSNSFEDDD